jgi:myo-inositol-1(or 4)-monophosphatase
MDLAYVAAGRFDGFWERTLNAWDAAAGVLLIREAGGLVTTYRGTPWSVDDRDVVAANHAALHAEILHELAG